MTIKYSFDEVGNPKDIKDEKTNRVLWQLSELYSTGSTKSYKLGNGATVFNDIDLSNGQIKAESVTGQDQTLQIARNYVPDANGNLRERKDFVTGVSEVFLYDSLDRLESLTGTGMRSISIKYEGVNRIKSRDDVGSYEYGPSCAGSIQSPFIPKKIGQKSYCADGRGNIIQAGGRSISFDVQNLPVDMKEGQTSVHYEYGLGRAVLSKEEIRGSDKTLTRYVGESFEIEESATGVREKTYVGDFLIIETEGNEYRENYLYKDFLGSTLAVADRAGNVTERLDYDPFGQRREPKDLEWLDGFKPKATSHGFTGHDHIESMNLIHMKGRVYDPTVGLFLSPDPYVQDPTLVQNLNRYSYVLNNPLSYTDPSGHFFKKLGKQISKGLRSAGKAFQNPGSFLQNTWNKSSRAATDPRYVRMAASIAISVVATAYCPYTAPSMWAQSAAYYAAVGATSSYVSSNGDMKAAVYGAATASAFNLVGSAFEYSKVGADGVRAKDLSTGMALAKVGTHGVVAGLSSHGSGDSFDSGFWSGALSQSLGGVYGAMGATDNAQGWSIAYNAILAGTVGGTISEATGGSFEQGALTTAMGRLFNDVFHGTPASYDERIPVLDDGGTEDYSLKMSRQYGEPKIYAIPMDSPPGLNESMFPELDRLAACAPGVMCSSIPLIGPRGSWVSLKPHHRK